MRLPQPHLPVNPLRRPRLRAPRALLAGGGAAVLAALLPAGAPATHAALRSEAPATGRLAPLAAEPTLRLTTRGDFDVPAARVGDTVRYRLRVEWTDVPATVMLLPRETLETPGLGAAGLSTLHRKRVDDGVVRNVTEYVYTLVAREAGRARVAPFTLRYHNGLTGREESVAVPGSALEIAPPRPPLAQRTGIRVLGLIVAATVLVELFRRWRAHRRRTPAAGDDGDPARAIDAEALAVLRRRCDTADPRAWLGDAERLATAWLCRRLGVRNPENVRFEAALQEYLARTPLPEPDESTSWSTLRDLFHEARYTPERRQPHELREACRRLATCLHIHGDNTP